MKFCRNDKYTKLDCNSTFYDVNMINANGYRSALVYDEHFHRNYRLITTNFVKSMMYQETHHGITSRVKAGKEKQMCESGQKIFLL